MHLSLVIHVESWVIFAWREKERVESDGVGWRSHMWIWEQ